MSGFGKIVAGYIFNDDMKEKLIKKMNDNVDIPLISEKTEEKILNAIWDSVEEVVKEALIED
jgi:nucleoid DNA-binding protein|tara:strand:+ start:1439 stop:1624 length:186 start_codon:yes stop_codon:yes gene_type:complete